MVKNLSQLKRKIASYSVFMIRNHRVPEYIGQKRKPVKVQTNGFYSVVINNPESRFSIEKNKKGIWIEYGKAADWEFDQNVCHKYLGRHIPENLVWSIEFCE